MPLSRSVELLEDLLADKQLSAPELDDLLAAQQREDQYLDYKDGRLTDDKEQARRVVREWVSGFANADGGALVLGVSEPKGDGKPRTVTGCTRIGGQHLAEWATRVLSDMAGYFSPQPRVQVVELPSGEVLIIAVARAPQLVPCVESRALKYFLRIGESTVEVPSFLLADLVLGRRNHPIFRASGPRIDMSHSRLEPPTGGEVHRGYSLILDLEVENDSLVAARNVRAGLLSWSMEQKASRVNERLMQYVVSEAPALSLRDAPPWQMVCRMSPVDVFPALSAHSIRFDALTVPAYPSADIEWALFVLPEGHPPSWFQVTVALRGAGATPDMAQVEPITRPSVRWAQGRAR